jgi:hypothetical protein
MAVIDRKIQGLRPKLYKVAPLTHAICWGYAINNIMLGLGMFFLYETSIPLVVTNILSFQAWGTLFFIIGLVSVFGLIKNNWYIVRNIQLVGLSLKAIWAIALIIRCFSAPQTILITLVWFFFVYIQTMTYIYFIPVKIKGVEEDART